MGGSPARRAPPGREWRATRHPRHRLSGHAARLGDPRRAHPHRRLPPRARCTAVIRLPLIMLALATWAATTPRGSQDQAGGCVSGEPAPVLDAASPLIHSHVFAITGVRTAEESAVLEPALPIHVSRAGCAHFSLVYSFSLAAPAPLGDSRTWLREASAVMRRIARAETAGFASTLAAALEKQARAR